MNRFAALSYLAAVLALGACAQPPLQAQPTARPTQAARVIVEFKQAVPYRSEAFVAALGQAAQARLAYVASVSDDTHVYQVTPLAGQTLASALGRLNAQASVKRTEIDQLMATPPLPPQK